MTPSWNPLRLTGTALPVPLLLSAKLIVVTMLATGHVTTLPDPFLPFLSVFDGIGDPERFRTALQVLFLAGSAALLFNRGVRAASFVVGMTILVGIASSRIYWANNTFFMGAVLTLIGLYASERSIWLLRIQVAMIYFGAGLNKALDPDWLSGQFFEHWTVNLEHDLYLRDRGAAAADGAVQIHVLGHDRDRVEHLRGLRVATAVASRDLARGPVPRGDDALHRDHVRPVPLRRARRLLRVRPLAPKTTTEVIYDGDCGICAKTRRWFEALDFEGAFRWTTFQSGTGDRFGISRDALAKRLHIVVDGERVAEGFQAFKLMLLYNPVTYFVMLGILLSLHWGPAWARSLAIAGMIAFFFPAFDRVGQAAYDLVARNRSRIGSEPTCAVE